MYSYMCQQHATSFTASHHLATVQRLPLTFLGSSTKAYVFLGNGFQAKSSCPSLSLNDVEFMMSDCFIASGSPFPLFILITITIYNYYPMIIMIIRDNYHDCPMIS